MLITRGYGAVPTTVSGGGADQNGYIQLEAGWQLVSVPIDKGYWDTPTSAHIHDDITEAKFENYILDQITDKYGADIVEVANTFLGDVQAFYTYVVGSTPTGSPHNFEMVYNDSGFMEITAFWIKIIGPDAPYLISWGEV